MVESGRSGVEADEPTLAIGGTVGGKGGDAHESTGLGIGDQLCPKHAIAHESMHGRVPTEEVRPTGILGEVLGEEKL